MGRTGRIVAAIALVGFAAVACAQPGQLGAPESGPAESGPAESGPAESGPAESGPAELPALLGRGLVDYPVQVTTPGPAVYSVRTVVVPPGGTTGWHVHPGTETSIVTSGALTMQSAGACEPIRYEAGDALFVPDAVPHVARNDGSVPAELVVGYLLAPGAPDLLDAPAACSP